MSSVYLETSALLRAILEGDNVVIEQVRAATARLVTSRLTFIETERSLLRAAREGRMKPGQQQEARKRVRELADCADVIAFEEPILNRSMQPFMVEPVRTLDALHLASILTYAQQVGGPMTVLSCDARIRDNARAYGFDVAPVGTAGARAT